LTNLDWVGFVSFASSAISYKNNLVRASDAQKKTLKNYISGLSSSGQTNFEGKNY